VVSFAIRGWKSIGPVGGRWGGKEFLCGRHSCINVSFSQTVDFFFLLGIAELKVVISNRTSGGGYLTICHGRHSLVHFVIKTKMEMPPTFLLRAVLQYIFVW
jgi:hypothetical protein